MFEKKSWLIVAACWVAAVVAWGHGGMGGQGGSQGGGPSHGKGRDEAGIDVQEEMELAMELAEQLRHASLSQTAEVWDSGPRDFKMDRGVVAAFRQASDYLAKALDCRELRREPEEEAEWRDKARRELSRIRPAGLSSARIWLMVSAGTLRKERESKPKPKAEAKAHYNCPIHPEVDEDHPGTCPKCHIDLVLKK